MCSLKKTLNKIRIAVLTALVMLNVISALVIALTIDGLTADSWQVWLTFLCNISFLGPMAYANGWMYGTEPWWVRKMTEQGHTCKNCEYRNRCMDRSRNYCCISYRERKDYEDYDSQREHHHLGRDQERHSVRHTAAG